LVGTLNMATALLVLILERSRMIGVLKALGATTAQVQKIFLFNAAYIIVKGLLWGNSLGLLLLFSQVKWQWMQLDPATYFVSSVPVYLPLHYILALNVLVLTICVGLLWIPSRIVGGIEPSRVLRFR
jgi:lipoprotein-releasing system permease protein